MKLIIIFMILNSMTFSAFLSGVIRDVESGKPLRCSIYIKETKFLTQSDSLGKFSLELAPGKYHLDILKNSYTTKHLEIQLDTTDVYLNIELHPLEFHFDNIKVTASRDSKFELIDQSKSVSGRELIEEQRSTIAGIIKHEAGIGIRSMGPAPARPVFRGIGGPSLVILEDGMNSIDASANSQDHAVALDPAFSKAIEIVNGPELLLYSSIANSAAINVKENNIPNEKSHKLDLNQKNIFESVSNRRGNYIEAKSPLIGFQTRASFNQSSSGDISTPEGNLRNSANSVTTYDIGVSRELGDYFFGANFKEHWNNYGIPPGGLGQHPLGVDIELFRRNIEIQASHKLSDFKNLSDANLIFQRTYFIQSEYESSGFLGARFLSENYNFRYELSTIDLLGFEQGKVGATYMKNYYDVGGAVLTPEVNSDQIAIFTNQKSRFGNFLFDLGLRYEFIHRNPKGDQSTGEIDISNKLFNIFSASAAIYYNKKNNLFGINIFRASRAPSDEELFSQGPHLAAYSYEIGDPALSEMVNYGYDLKYSFKDKNIQLSASQYCFYYTNYITPRNTGEIDKIRTQLPIFQISNNAALFLGLDAGLTYYLSNSLIFESDISYTFAENLDSERNLPFIPPLKAHLKINYNTSKYRFFIRSEIVNSQNRTDFFETRTAGYYLIDVGGSYFLSYEKIAANFGLSIENLTNNLYFNHLSRIKDIMSEPGINFKFFVNFYY